MKKVNCCGSNPTYLIVDADDDVDGKSIDGEILMMMMVTVKKR
jgi:hypothetical protein